MDKNAVIKGLYDISGFIAGRIGFEQAKNFMHIIDEAIALLEECAVKVDKQAENLPNENRKIEKKREIVRCQNCEHAGKDCEVVSFFREKDNL